MSDITGLAITIILLVVPLIVIGTIIYLIVQATKHKEENEMKFKLSAKMLFQIYLYMISFLTLGIAVIGGTSAIKAALSYKLGSQFSYTLYKGNNFEETKVYDPTLTRDNFQICSDGEPVVISGTQYCTNPKQASTDLVNGLTIFVSMLILFGIHQYGISRLDKKEKLDWLPKIYTFASLIVYSIAGLIAIPTAIYQLANYLITKPEDYTYSTPEAPATAIAVVILTLPLWIYFLGKTSKIKD